MEVTTDSHLRDPVFSGRSLTRVGEYHPLRAAADQHTRGAERLKQRADQIYVCAVCDRTASRLPPSRIRVENNILSIPAYRSARQSPKALLLSGVRKSQTIDLSRIIVCIDARQNNFTRIDIPVRTRWGLIAGVIIKILGSARVHRREGHPGTGLPIPGANFPRDVGRLVDDAQ